MPPVISPPIEIIPPASAVIIWALPTNFDVIRCLAWEEDESNWRIAIVFGNDLLKTELVPDLKTLMGVADLIRRALEPPFAFVRLAPPETRRLHRRRRRAELVKPGDK